MPRRNISRHTRKTWWEDATKKKKGLRVCTRCVAVYYDGCWHTQPEFAEQLLKSKTASTITKELCLACSEVMHGAESVNAGFEGQLILDGLRDEEEKKEILKTVRNTSRAMTKRDPEDQITNIDDRGDRVIITTSENQMAVGLGKAVHEAFKGGTLRITWSEDDLPARAYWKHKKTVH